MTFKLIIDILNTVIISIINQIPKLKNLYECKFKFARTLMNVALHLNLSFVLCKCFFKL